MLTTKPIRVDWIEPSPWDGRLGMTFLPGKRGIVGRAGTHDRDLEEDVARLRDHWEVDVFLLLLEDEELRRIGVDQIVEVMNERGIEAMRHPVVDGGVPADSAAFRATLDLLLGSLHAGKRVVIACMGGLGRTGTTAACLLREAGVGPKDAIATVRQTRHGAIENPSQEAFVRAWQRAVRS
jgi:Cyclin-dependent kinase inhibitor 3 (CDKN3)